MSAANQAGTDAAASVDAARQPLFQLSRQLAHDFNTIWARIFGLAQQAREATGFNSREDLLDRLAEVCCSGLFYSRNVMESLANSDAAPQVFDVCTAVREWGAESENTLRDTISLSCLVPSCPLYIHFPPSALRLLLLSLVGCALRSGDGKPWAMLGVRNAKGEKRATDDEADTADIMFLCQLDEDANTSMSYNLRQRVETIRAVVAPYGGTVQARVVAQVGVNVRIHLPLAPTPGDAVESDGAK